jgi:cytochrome c peroxidase
MNVQQAALEQLDLPAEGVTPPPGVDPYIWTASIVPGNEPTAERVALGRDLYFDTRLSLDGTVACATCHDVTRGFTDQRSVSEGVKDQLGRRNAPTTLNAMLFTTQFWDGRSENVEHQAGMPVVNPIEMGMPDHAAAVERVAAVPEYVQAFQVAYGRDVNYEDIRAAIGAFERTLVFLDAPFDRYLAGDASAMSEAAIRGLELYEGKGRCVSCHPINTSNPIGSDHLFHNIGVAAHDKDFESLAATALKKLAADTSEQALDELALSTDLSELGRFMVTKNRNDIGAFKTEQVRNIGITAPYMHDGSMTTLWDVIDHYNKGGEDNLYLDGGIEALALTEAEIDDLVAFLFALTDTRFADANAQAMDRQRAHAANNRPFRDEALADREVLGFERRVMDQK